MAETTYYPDQDCWFDSESDSAADNSTTLHAGVTPLTVIGRSLLRFNLSAIVSHYIDAATLTLTTASTEFAGSLVIARVTRSWTEAANRVNYDGTNPWTSVGGDYTLAGAATLSWNGTSSTIVVAGRVLTSLVRTCVDTDSGYVNFIIGSLLGGSQYQAGVTFYSSEYATVASRPKLVIESTSGERITERDTSMYAAASIGGVGIVNAPVFLDPPSRFTVAAGGSFDVN